MSGACSPAAAPSTGWIAVALLIAAAASTVSSLQCYQCSSQSEPACADPFIVPSTCQHSEPRHRDVHNGRQVGNVATSSDRSSQDMMKRASFLAACPEKEDGRTYFCLKTWQVDMGAVLVTRTCGWEEEDRQGNCSREDWTQDQLSIVCACFTEACNSARRGSPDHRPQIAAMAAILVLSALVRYLSY